jgi:hypothetical protein
MMQLAECIWDSVNESKPKELKAGDWHIPFSKSFLNTDEWINLCNNKRPETIYKDDWEDVVDLAIKVSVAMAARTSYTVVGDEKEIDYNKMIELHDRLLNQEPPHSSPFEHTARAMSNKEYNEHVKGNVYDTQNILSVKGWCYNLKGFISYRYFIDNKINY